MSLPEFAPLSRISFSEPLAQLLTSNAPSHVQEILDALNPEAAAALRSELSDWAGRFAAAQSRLALATPSRQTSDVLLNVAEVSRRTGLTTRWLYRHAKELPFSVKISHRQRRFSERGVERWIKLRHQGLSSF